MHIKDFHKNEESLYHEIFSPIKHQSEMDASAKDIGNDIKDYEWTHKWNNLVTFSSRNQMLDTYVIRIMEKRFISMLVKYFPDQAGEVVKYIKAERNTGKSFSKKYGIPVQPRAGMPINKG